MATRVTGITTGSSFTSVPFVASFCHPLSFVLLLLLLLPARPNAQTFSSRATAVRVDVLVTDGRTPVSGLSVADFELRDNGVLQRIELADAGELPLNAILTLDTSASLLGKRRDDLVGAADTLLDGLKPADRAALITFGRAARSRIALTDNLDSVRSALHRIEPKGQTSLMDGAFVALTSTLDQPGRSLIVVCTDGSDTFSWLQPSEVIEVSKRSNAVVYAVTAADAKRPAALKQLAEASGGRLFPVKSSAELRTTFKRILDEFRSRYVLAYTPNGVAPGGFHRIAVTVPRRKLTVAARPGYMGADGGGTR